MSERKWTNAVVAVAVIIVFISVIEGYGIMQTLGIVFGAMLLLAMFHTFYREKVGKSYGAKLKMEIDAYQKEIKKRGRTPGTVMFELYSGPKYFSLLGADSEKCYRKELVITDTEIRIPSDEENGQKEIVISAKSGIQKSPFPLQTEEGSETSSTTKTVTKQADVSKSAFWGGVVGGSAGAIVGAISAADANSKGGVTRKVTETSTGRWLDICLYRIDLSYKELQETRRCITRFVHWDHGERKDYRFSFYRGAHKQVQQIIDFIDKTMRGEPAELPNARYAEKDKVYDLSVDSPW